MHNKYKELNTYEGEWFEPSPELLAFIEIIKQKFSQKLIQQIPEIYRNKRVQIPKKENLYAKEGKKQCTKCLRILLFNDFYKNNRSGDGLTGHCRDCMCKKI